MSLYKEKKNTVLRFVYSSEVDYAMTRYGKDDTEPTPEPEPKPQPKPNPRKKRKPSPPFTLPPLNPHPWARSKHPLVRASLKIEIPELPDICQSISTRQTNQNTRFAELKTRRRRDARMDRQDDWGSPRQQRRMEALISPRRAPRRNSQQNVPIKKLQRADFKLPMLMDMGTNHVRHKDTQQL